LTNALDSRSSRVLNSIHTPNPNLPNGNGDAQLAAMN